MKRSFLFSLLLAPSLALALAACGDDATDEPAGGSAGAAGQSTGGNAGAAGQSAGGSAGTGAGAGGSSGAGAGGDAGAGGSSAAGAGGDAGTAGAAGAAGSGANAACAPASPDTYDAAGYEANAAAELAVRAQHKAFMAPMQDAEKDLVNKPTADQIRALFDAGTPSLRSITSPYYAAKVDGLIDAFALAAGKTWTPAEPPAGDGGKFGNFIFTSRGVDIRQAIDKGLYGAAFYNHAVTLSAAPEGPQTVDRIVAIFGAHPSFPADDKAMENPDIWAALYAERREKKDAAAPGPYTRIKRAFVRAKAAATVGAACDAERDAALAEVTAEWERVLFATVTFYMNDAAKKLSVDPPTDVDQGGGLHGAGEARGFMEGFRQLPAGKRKITDAQIDELLALLGAPADGDATAYKLVTDSATTLPKLGQVTAKIAEIYGFTADDLETFKTNH